MSSLSNKSFDLKPLKPLHAELQNRLESASAKADFQEESYIQFFTFLAQLQGGKLPRMVDWDLISFAGDHGIAKTFKEHQDFKTGPFLMEAMRNERLPQFGSKGNGFQHYWVDLGVDYAFESNFNYWLNHSNRLINSKIKPSTESFDLYPSMTDDELSIAFHTGQKMVDRAHYHNRDLLCFHSLGQGQVYSVYALAWALSISKAKAWAELLPSYYSLEKLEEVIRLTKKHPISHNPFTNLCFFGGFEIVALVGAILRAGEKGVAFILADPASIIAWQYAAKISPGIEKRGYALGRFASSLGPSFNVLPESIHYSPSGEEWYPFFWKLKHELRRFSQK